MLLFFGVKFTIFREELFEVIKDPFVQSMKLLSLENIKLHCTQFLLDNLKRFFQPRQDI